MLIICANNSKLFLGSGEASDIYHDCGRTRVCVLIVLKTKRRRRDWKSVIDLACGNLGGKGSSLNQSQRKNISMNEKTFQQKKMAVGAYADNPEESTKG